MHFVVFIIQIQCAYSCLAIRLNDEIRDKYVELSGVQALKNQNLLKDVEASVVFDVVVLV